jgi:hypothetical protein
LLKAAGQTQQALILLNKTVAELNSLKISTANFSQTSLQVAKLEASLNSAEIFLEGGKIIDAIVIFSFNNFSAKNITWCGSSVCAISSAPEGIYQINQTAGKLIAPNLNYNLICSEGDSIIFFNQPDTVSEYKNGALLPSIKLGLPYANVGLDDIASYSGNLYFIDKKNRKVIKYQRSTKGYSQPQIWLASDVKLQPGAVSLAIDRNVWLLNQDGSVDKYFAGQFAQTLKPSYLPLPDRPIKIRILPELPNLYVLDAGRGRIIIMSKTGQIIEQLVNEKFKGALDFVVKSDGKQIIVLSQNQLLSVFP